ncbi:hypothetical protein C0Q70_02969 [Pomacea canaliculata]|uniref:Calcineurin-like phosphoesterase domain-containing protein n=1 Tax=Pomacea canaliculata TaxID=400727 RepID=A0A2T7PRE7_POMCA|nr:hypothetical protein C0Q70_02969 [Pomacea canaliculata]
MNSSNSQKRRHKSNPGSQQTEPLNAKIEVEPNTHNPDLLWETLKQLHPVYRIGWSYAATQPPDSLRFVSHLPHRIKVVTAGNHEVTFDEFGGGGTHPTLERLQLGLPQTASHKEVAQGCKELLHDVLYLEDEVIEICGIKIYGTPWVPRFGTSGFSCSRGLPLLEIWDKIPTDTDILLTHSPPLGYGDTTKSDKHVGCAELLNTVTKRVKPKFHVYGHIHNGYGVFSNGKTTFINASVCNDQYRPVHEPVVFDFPLPPGYCRGDFMKLSLETLQEQRLLSGSFMKTRKKETAFNMTKIEKVINGIDAQTASD